MIIEIKIKIAIF